MIVDLERGWQQQRRWLMPIKTIEQKQMLELSLAIKIRISAEELWED